MRQALASLSILVVLAVGVTRPVFAATCWEPPVTAPMVDPYRPPACPWCPGNRGLTFGTSPGAVSVPAATSSASRDHHRRKGATSSERKVGLQTEIRASERERRRKNRVT